MSNICILVTTLLNSLSHSYRMIDRNSRISTWIFITFAYLYDENHNHLTKIVKLTLGQFVIWIKKKPIDGMQCKFIAILIKRIQKKSWTDIGVVPIKLLGVSLGPFDINCHPYSINASYHTYKIFQHFQVTTCRRK